MITLGAEDTLVIDGDRSERVPGVQRTYPSQAELAAFTAGAG